MHDDPQTPHRPTQTTLTTWERARLRVREALASSYSAKVLARQLTALGIDCRAEGVHVEVDRVTTLIAHTAHSHETVILQQLANRWTCAVTYSSRERRLIGGEDLEHLLTDRIFDVDWFEDDYKNISLLIETEEIPDPYFWRKATGIGFSVENNKVESIDGECVVLNFDPSAKPKRRWTGRARGQTLESDAEVIDYLYTKRQNQKTVSKNATEYEDAP